MRFLRQSLTGLLMLSLTLGLLAYAGQMIFSAVSERMAKEPQVPQRRERVFAVNLVKASEGTAMPVLKAFGEISSRRTLEIRAKTGGTLVELAETFEEGASVSAGQLLARIDPADAQSALGRARSDRMDAEAEVRDAQRALALARDELAAAQSQEELRAKALTRQRDLEERGVTTAATVETAELAHAQARQTVLARRQALTAAEARTDQARTRLKRAAIALAEARRRLEDTRITAGFTGTLSDVAVVEGGLVSANERLADLIDSQALEVAFRVSTPQYARLLDGTGELLTAPVTVVLESYGMDLEAQGRITRAGAAVGEGRTGRVIFARLEAAPGLKPGDFVTVRVEEPPLERVIRLPASALGPDGDVLVIDAEERLQAIPVKLMRRQGDDILVRAAALDGREVVAERTPLLGAGIKVRPLRGEAARTKAGKDEQLVELSADRRARLLAFVRGQTDMPEAVRSRLLGQIESGRVSARVIERLETRMGG